MSFDYIIVGAGLAGITAAEELANRHNKKVLLIDKRDHIGGNCYDYRDENGNMVHKYGPHIFTTDNSDVYRYLSSFTKWHNYTHKIILEIDHTLIPMPFNFISIDKILKKDSGRIKKALLEKYYINSSIPIKELMKSDDEYIRKLGDALYSINSEYCKKLYLVDDEEVKELVDMMHPFRMSYDCRVYKSIYQTLPSNGYTNMFKNMLSNPNITLILNEDYHDKIDVDYENKKIFYEYEEFEGHLIFTAGIDEFFDYKFGRLAYNSLIYDLETVYNSIFQDNSVIAYPTENHFTRITDYAYISKDHLATTAIQLEYPVEYNEKIEGENIPYYPITLKKNLEIYEKYRELSEDYDNVTFVGRLAEYKLFKMDEIVERVLDIVNNKLIEP